MLKNKIKNNSYQIFIQKNLTTLNKDKIFLTDQYTKFSYKSLDQLSDSLSNLLLSRLQVKDLGGEKIGVFCNNNYTYLISLLAIWRSNGTPMCLSKLYPVDYLDYFVTDSKCKLIINGYNSLENSSVDLESLTYRKNIVNFHLEENKFYKTIHSSKLSSLNDDNIFQLQDFKNSNRDALLLCIFNF
jgi:long-subunit acyl-CoA synthetase (AMP-forming)